MDKINKNTGVYDFTEAIDLFDNSKKFPPNGKYAPQHFFRAALCGPSGCGKTSCLLSMIIPKDPEIRIGFDKIWVYAKDVGEPAYEMLKKVLQDVEQELRRREKKDASWKYFVMSDNLKEVPPVKDMDKKIRNLVIFDDWATCSEKEQQIISEYYKMGRKHSCSMFYLSQGYTEIPKFIRKQLTHLFIWKLRTARDVRFILSEHNPGFEDDVLNQMYCAATKEKYSFLLIDKTNPDRPIRMGFKNFPVFDGRCEDSEEYESEDEYGC